jgi:hypothetical protein
MAVVIYNDYSIVAVAKQEQFAGRWCVSVDLSSRNSGGPTSSFETSHEFETQAQAENCGLNLARAWIDQRLKRPRSIEREAPLETQNYSAATTQREHQPPISTLSSIQGDLRSEVREFAERIEETLRQDETKKNDSWTKSSVQELVHQVLDNTSALLMMNYNDESQRALLQATCLDMATLALIIRRKTMHTSNTQPARASAPGENEPSPQHPASLERRRKQGRPIPPNTGHK